MYNWRWSHSFTGRDFLNDDVAEFEIGGGVVPLELNRPGVKTQTAARVGIGFSGIRPVRDLFAVNPYGKMISDCVDIDVDPFFVVSDNLSSVHAAENAACSAVFRLGSIAIEEAEMHLTFVTVHLFARNAAEKDA